jgi:undecaprenyl-diphosphatase
MLQLERFDRWALHALVRRRRGVSSHVLRTVTHLGDMGVVVGVAAAVSLGLLPGLENAGVVAAVALVVSHGFVQVLKRTITRPRPRLPVGVRSLVAAPDRFSFPSGHATASLSVALPIAAALPAPLAALVLGSALLVGLSRCYLGVHYPGDVLAGWLLAAAAVLLAPPLLAGLGWS